MSTVPDTLFRRCKVWYVWCVLCEASTKYGIERGTRPLVLDPWNDVRGGREKKGVVADRVRQQVVSKNSVTGK